MARANNRGGGDGPGTVGRAVSALNAWFGDYLDQTGNGLRQAMAFYRDNRPLAPEDIEVAPTGRVCVLVHGLGCTEALWDGPADCGCGGYGELLQQRHGYTPLYLRYNTGLRISANGRQLAGLLERLCVAHGPGLDDVLLIGHSMGGLVIRSACHLARESGQDWVSRVRHVVYLGSPHLGAPLEKAANVATHLLGLVDSTAGNVMRDLLNSRSSGVKDLRFGNLVDQDWLDCDPDELMNNRRVPIPWLATARHLRVVGQALDGSGLLGDGVVSMSSAAGVAHGDQPGAPGAADVCVAPGVSHLRLAHNPSVYRHIERWVTDDG